MIKLTNVHFQLSCLHSYFLISVSFAKIFVTTVFNDTSIYSSRQAAFGPNYSSYGLRGFLVVGKPIHGCSSLQRPPTHNLSYFVLLKRGDCDFDVMVWNAQKAGYKSAIISNDNSNSIIRMRPSKDWIIRIPSTFVGEMTGDIFRTLYTYDKKAVLRITGQPIISFERYLIPFASIIGLCFLTMLSFVTIKLIKERQKTVKSRLPRRTLKLLQVLKFKTEVNEYEVCSICLEEYMEGDKLRVLPCKHAFHCVCIDPWLTKNRRNCPLCKRRINRKCGDIDSHKSETSNDFSSDERTPLVLGEAPLASEVSTYQSTQLANDNVHYSDSESSFSSDGEIDYVPNSISNYSSLPA